MNGNRSHTRGVLRALFADEHFEMALLAAPLIWPLLLLLLLYEVSPETGGIDLWPGVVMLGLVRPVLEEWAFRGVLQPWLRWYAMGRYTVAGVSGANVAASVVFTGLHFLAHPPLWAAAVFLPSLVFGVFRDRYDSAIPSMLLHVYYNLGYFTLVALAAPVTAMNPH